MNNVMPFLLFLISLFITRLQIKTNFILLIYVTKLQEIPYNCKIFFDEAHLIYPNEYSNLFGHIDRFSTIFCLNIEPSTS
jgi:hypothetical protein